MSTSIPCPVLRVRLYGELHVGATYNSIGLFLHSRPRNLCRKGSHDRRFNNGFRRDYRSNSIPNYNPRKNAKKYEDYTDAFLCHARVYVFAEKYDIARLRVIALHKLQQTLKIFHVYNKRIGNIVSLVRYSYSNGNTRDSEVGQDIDALRKLIIYYVVCVFETVVKDDSFLALMEEGGPLIRDLTGMLLKRIE